MVLPEPKFEITVFQLETILKEYGVAWQEEAIIPHSEFIQILRNTCTTHLDTAKQ